MLRHTGFLCCVGVGAWAVGLFLYSAVGIWAISIIVSAFVLITAGLLLLWEGLAKEVVSRALILGLFAMAIWFRGSFMELATFFGLATVAVWVSVRDTQWLTDIPVGEALSFAAVLLAFSAPFRMLMQPGGVSIGEATLVALFCGGALYAECYLTATLQELLDRFREFSQFDTP